VYNIILGRRREEGTHERSAALLRSRYEGMTKRSYKIPLLLLVILVEDCPKMMVVMMMMKQNFNDDGSCNGTSSIVNHLE
jgi:hypothetical protein